MDVFLNDVVSVASPASISYDGFQLTSNPAALREAACCIAPLLPECDTLVAPGSGAIAFATALQLSLLDLGRSVNVAYVRDAGRLKPGESRLCGSYPKGRLLFVDDVVMHGRAFDSVHAFLREAGLSTDWVGAAMLVDACLLTGTRRLSAQGIPIFSAFNRRLSNLTSDDWYQAQGLDPVPLVQDSEVLAQLPGDYDNTMYCSVPHVTASGQWQVADSLHRVYTESTSWVPNTARSKGITQQHVVDDQGRRMLAGYDGHLYCMGNDSPVWSCSVGSFCHATPVWSEHHKAWIQAVEEWNGQEAGSIAFVSATGKLLSKYTYSDRYAPCTPAVYGPLVFNTANDGYLYCLTSESTVWKVPTRGLVRGRVCLHKNLVIVATEEGWVQAFDVGSGDVVWEKVWASNFKVAMPEILNGVLVVCDDRQYVHGLDPETGLRMWLSKTRSRVLNKLTPWNGKYLAVGMDGDVSLLDPTTGRKLAASRLRLRGAVLQPGHVVDDHLYLFTSLGQVSRHALHSR